MAKGTVCTPNMGIDTPSPGIPVSTLVLIPPFMVSIPWAYEQHSARILDRLRAGRRGGRPTTQPRSTTTLSRSKLQHHNPSITSQTQNKWENTYHI